MGIKAITLITVRKRRLTAALLILVLYFQAVSFVPLFAKTGPIVSKAIEQPVSQAETIVVYGPRRFDRTGQLSKFSEQFTLPANAVAPFNIQIVNGSLDGTNRVLSGTVRLNGVVLADSNQLNIAVPSTIRSIQLAA